MLEAVQENAKCERLFRHFFNQPPNVDWSLSDGLMFKTRRSKVSVNAMFNFVIMIQNS